MPQEESLIKPEDFGLKLNNFPEDSLPQLMDAMMQVIDPELGVDLLNLGLFYELSLDAAGFCKADMLLTTIGCPLTDYLEKMVRQGLEGVDVVQEVQVRFMYEPQWTIQRMSRYARMALHI